MSVRAYRINKIDRKTQPTFNVWYNEKFMNFLETHPNEIWDGRNMEGAGVIEIPIAVLKEAVRKAEKLELSNDDIADIKDDIKFAEKGNGEYVLYDCF